MNNKHAYLLLVHEYNYVLETLIKMLDDKRNDIFIHIDKKCKDLGFEKLKTRSSKLYFTKRIKTHWGGYSLVDAELILLESAFKTDSYSYYHLLSGSCLPIKSQNYIHNFFDNHINQEFVSIDISPSDDFYDRVLYRYPLQNIGKKNSYITYAFNQTCYLFQKTFKIKRNANIAFYKGPQWFSISEKFVKYLLSKKDKIIKVFKYTYICDELFVSTIIMNSEFKKNINNKYGYLRLIDWNHGDPYVFTSKDYNTLCQSKALFARKFSSATNKEIVNKIYETFTN